MPLQTYDTQIKGGGCGPNYTKNAQRYLDSIPIIRGINGYELVDLVLKHYNDLDEKYRELVPLKMVYIPVKPKDE